MISLITLLPSRIKRFVINKAPSDFASVRTDEPLKFWAIARHGSVVPVTVVCLAVLLATPCMVKGVVQPARADTSAQQTTDAASIGAKPEYIAVTVSGFAENAPAARTTLWQGTTRWLVIMAVIAVLYIAVYLSSTGTLRTTFPTEPTTSPRRLHVGRNLLLGVAAFICLDGIIFHTGLYTSILAPDSYAGRLAVITRAEKQRPPSGLKEVLVLGDSRMAEGFSTAVADQLGSAAGFKFVNLTEPASTVNSWYYMLREVDPAARRYSAIVVPYGIGYEPTTADPLRISMAAPLLRYGDCFNFASAFQRWSGRFRAFTACILRGSAY